MKSDVDRALEICTSAKDRQERALAMKLRIEGVGFRFPELGDELFESSL